MIRKTFALAVITLAAMFPAAAAAQIPWEPPSPKCFEDMPCFDCHTMGNHRCG